MKEKIKEFVEATLIIGARRGSDGNLTHDSAKILINQHTENLTNRFLKLVLEEVHELLPNEEEIKLNANHDCSINVCPNCGSREKCDMKCIGDCLPTDDIFCAFVDGSNSVVSHIENKMIEFTAHDTLMPEYDSSDLNKFCDIITTTFNKVVPEHLRTIDLTNYKFMNLVKFIGRDYVSTSMLKKMTNEIEIAKTIKEVKSIYDFWNTYVAEVKDDSEDIEVCAFCNKPIPEKSVIEEQINCCSKCWKKSQTITPCLHLEWIKKNISEFSNNKS